jgi:hypothetical protein
MAGGLTLIVCQTISVVPIVVANCTSDDEWVVINLVTGEFKSILLLARGETVTDGDFRSLWACITEAKWSRAE